MLRLCVFLVLSVSVLQAAEIKGKVSNALGGEALERVQITVLETKAIASTASDGTFAIRDLAPGSYTLRLNAVSYRLLTIPFILSSADEVKEFSITLVPDNFRHTDKVEVRGDVFQGPDSASVAEFNLNSSEIKEASTVFADDPFRAVQAMPGVSASANNELLAEFSVMGAPFESIGIYLDDVLLPRPFHTVQNLTNGASLSLLTSETVQDLKLLPVAYPEKFGDNVGAALDMTTRDGSRTAPLFRASIGLADTDFLGEGQLGHGRRGSWLASARKSYLGYLVKERLEDFSDISFYDADFKLTYDIAPQHNLTLYGLGGHANIERSRNSTDAEFVKAGSSDFIFFRAGWRWSVTPQLLLDSRAAFIQQPVNERNPSRVVFRRDSYGEWVGGGNVAWSWNKNAVLEGGWTLRRLADHFFFRPGDPFALPIDNKQSILRGDVYLQQSSSFLKNRVHVLGGLRWDGRQKLGSDALSPQISVAVQAAKATQLQFGFGKYNQFQFPDQAPPPPSNVCLTGSQDYQRANHYTAAVEQRFGENIRLRLGAFDREGDNFLVITASAACPSNILSGTFNSRRRYSRGAQIILQRRSANRLSGWLGYTLVYARQNDLFFNSTTSFYSPYYVSPEDQRHAVNAFASYRLTPSVNISAKVLYGSGFPGSTGLSFGPGNAVHLVPVLRVGPYQRLDARVDKTWAFKRWKATLYGEVLNLTNHNNRIVNDVSEINQQIIIDTQRAIPITPTAGLVLEF